VDACLAAGAGVVVVAAVLVQSAASFVSWMPWEQAGRVRLSHHGDAGRSERGHLAVVGARGTCLRGSPSRAARRSVGHSAVTLAAVDDMKMLQAWKRA
jgi:hypothetical protein